ncbi:hypothetical protein [Angustibacter aerolatus]
MSALVGTLAGAVGVGFVSALLPFVPAEAAVTAGAVSTSGRAAAVLAGLCVALGQTGGKIVLYELARRGRRMRGRTGREHKPLKGWQARSIELLQNRWSGGGVVLLSASVGFPPLLVVAVVAGAVKLRRLDFIVCCLVGRSIRFVVLALIADGALH